MAESFGLSNQKAEKCWEKLTAINRKITHPRYSSEHWMDTYNFLWDECIIPMDKNAQEISPEAGKHLAMQEALENRRKFAGGPPGYTVMHADLLGEMKALAELNYMFLSPAEENFMTTALALSSGMVVEHD